MKSFTLGEFYRLLRRGFSNVIVPGAVPYGSIARGGLLVSTKGMFALYHMLGHLQGTSVLRVFHTVAPSTSVYLNLRRYSNVVKGVLYDRMFIGIVQDGMFHRVTSTRYYESFSTWRTNVASHRVSILLNVYRPATRLFPSQGSLGLVRGRMAPFYTRFTLRERGIVGVLFLRLERPLVLGISMGGLFPHGSLYGRILCGFRRRYKLSDPTRSGRGVINVQFGTVQ